MRLVIALLVLALFAPLPLTAQENPRLAQRTAVYWSLQSSVVLYGLTGSTPPKEAFFCGGTLIAPDRVLTAAHCVDGTRGFLVRTYGGESLTPKHTWFCVECDLAVVELDKPTKGRPAVLSVDAAVGDTVRLIGAPDGEAFIVTQGIVSKVVRDAFDKCDATDVIGIKEQVYLFVDAPTYFGNSGGGLFDDRGNLLGVLVRVSVAVGDCKMYLGQHILWGYAVGAQSVKDWMEGRK